MGKDNSQAGIPPKPACLSVIPENIPDDLKHFPQWICWRLAWDPKNRKWTKPPYQINGHKADKTNPAHWSSYDEVVAAYQDDEGDFDGIGFCVTENDPFTFADLDDCLIDAAAQKRADYIVGCLDSYTEKSPSDEGLRGIVKGKLPANRRKKGIEFYSSVWYLTITGNVYLDKGIKERQNELDQLYQELFPDTQQTAKPESDHTEWTQADKDLCVKVSNSRQGEKFQRLFSGNIYGYETTSEADLALCSILTFWTSKDAKQIDRIFRQSNLYRPKWDELRGEQTYGAITIGKAISRCGETYQGKKATVEPAAADDDADDITIIEWPVLDDKALHGFAGRFVRFATENSEADPAAVLATFLVRFGVEVNNPILWVGDTKHRANLSAVLVGASSKARKGTSAKPVERLFEPLLLDDDNLVGDRARTTPGPFSSGEGIVWAVRDAVWGTDRKTGKLIEVDPGVSDKRLFVLDEEFGGVMTQTKREGNVLSMIIRTVWDTGNLDPLTKTSKVKATGAHIGWVSHITVFELLTRLSESESLNGFANRILWVCARRTKLVPWPAPMDRAMLGQYQHELSEILAAHRGTVEVRPDKEVLQAWSDKYYRQLTEERPGLAGCVVNRAESQVMRLAMVYSLLDKSHVIRLEHLEAAIAFWRYCEESALYIFDGRQGDGVAQRITEHLQDGPKTATEIHRLFSSHVTKERLKRALTELEGAGRIGTEKETTGGRPTTTYFLKDLSVKRVKSVETEEPGITGRDNILITLNTPGVKKIERTTSGNNGLHYAGVV
ncbi:phage NrS-1 polymerase family protein [Desulfofustis limnaeus]|uniref:NrS-1 polymerase-like HBD domain-containing protein n=1 Tax=Desulfofustis limnaeus TaxID=2740163 RepID=A0ABM7WD47_9BACT|nr:hypothetical protein [Desulfofustis limnaeus]BDD88851.1 hypothetical protein DPPLL_32160 [Desulfofustis limnaeus]